MFKTHVGPIESDENVAYLRPETAQMIYLNFRLTQESARLKLPFGIAQIGKAYRNEIVPRDFLFRMREFEQMEMQYFIKTGDSAEIVVEPLQPLCIEKSSDNPKLAKFAIRDMGRTVAAGMCIDLVKK